MLTQYVKALEKKHAKDLADLKIEIASAAKEKNEELQRELREERKELEDLLLFDRPELCTSRTY